MLHKLQNIYTVNNIVIYIDSYCIFWICVRVNANGSNVGMIMWSISFYQKFDISFDCVWATGIDVTPARFRLRTQSVHQHLPPRCCGGDRSLIPCVNSDLSRDYMCKCYTLAVFKTGPTMQTPGTGVRRKTVLMIKNKGLKMRQQAAPRNFKVDNQEQGFRWQQARLGGTGQAGACGRSAARGGGGRFQTGEKNRADLHKLFSKRGVKTGNWWSV